MSIADTMWLSHYAPCDALRPPPGATRVGVLLTTDMPNARRPVMRVLSAVAAGFAVAALYVWDDALIAAPIVAATAIFGPVVAFIFFATLNTITSFVLAILAIRAYDRWTSGQPSRFAQWLDRQREARRTGWAQRVVSSSRIIGFVVSSFLLGGFVTTFLIRYGGRREHIERVAFLSSLIFGITFTGVYTGLGHVIFSI